MPLILALQKQRQEIPEFKASLVYKVSSRIARATERNSLEEQEEKISHQSQEIRVSILI